MLHKLQHPCCGSQIQSNVSLLLSTRAFGGADPAGFRHRPAFDSSHYGLALHLDRTSVAVPSTDDQASNDHFETLQLASTLLHVRHLSNGGVSRLATSDEGAGIRWRDLKTPHQSLHRLLLLRLRSASTLHRVDAIPPPSSAPRPKVRSAAVSISLS